MGRLYFYVVDVGNDEWEVRTQDASTDNAPVMYANAYEAIEAATRSARARWQRTQQPTGVRVQTSLGGWREERNFGPIPDSGPSPIAADTPRHSPH